MARTLDQETARDRILITAGDLFYRNGYRATGINEVIQKAGVAKATFYSNFKSKDALCLAYLKNRNENEAAEILDFVGTKRTPLTRFYGVMDSVEPWAIRTKFRGCQFINIVPEVPDEASELRKQGHAHYDWAKDFVHTLADELIASDKKYKHLKADELTAAYMTHLAGAIALAGVYNDIKPIQDGMNAVRQLVN